MNEHEIKVGDLIQGVFEVFSENKVIKVRNLYSGKIIEIYEPAESCVYVRLDNLDKLIPINIGPRRLT